MYYISRLKSRYIVYRFDGVSPELHSHFSNSRACYLLSNHRQFNLTNRYIRLFCIVPNHQVARYTDIKGSNCEVVWLQPTRVEVRRQERVVVMLSHEGFAVRCGICRATSGYRSRISTPHKVPAKRHKTTGNVCLSPVDILSIMSSIAPCNNMPSELCLTRHSSILSSMDMMSNV